MKIKQESIEFYKLKKNNTMIEKRKILYYFVIID